MSTHKCPVCNGDGKETCTNPDHGFFSMVSFHDVGRIGCPCCGHDEEHKIRHYCNGSWVQDNCEECSGSGKVTESECNSILEDYEIDLPTEDFKL